MRYCGVREFGDMLPQRKFGFLTAVIVWESFHSLPLAPNSAVID